MRKSRHVIERTAWIIQAKELASSDSPKTAIRLANQNGGVTGPRDNGKVDHPGIYDFFGENSLLKASKKTEELKIEDVMNFEPFVVDPDTPVAKLAGDLIEQNIGSAIVRATDSNKWGIFTVTDALKIIRDHVQ